MNENILLQIQQIDNKIERLKVQREFYQQILKSKDYTLESKEKKS